MEDALAELSAKLATLPRMTREVFKFLVERSTNFEMREPKLRRIYRGNDLDGDLALLLEAGLLVFNEAEGYDNPAYWRIRFPRRDIDFNLSFDEYTKELNIDLRKPLVVLDFSDY